MIIDQSPAEIALEMRAAIREALLDPANCKPGGDWFHHVKRLMPPAMRHDFRWKYLNEEEAMEIVRERGWIARARRCPRCPFVHLSMAGLR